MDNESKIEGIKRRLYERNDTVSHRVKEGVIHPVKHSVNNEWDNKELNLDDMKKPHTSIFKKFFIFSIIFLLCSLGIAFYMFSKGGTSVSNDNIEIKVVGSAFTAGGEELPLQIEVVNRNKANLELANLQVSYPSGASDNVNEMVRLPRIDIGTIKPGETIIKNIKVVLYGEEKSYRNVNINLDYHPEGSNAIFTKESVYTVNISKAPISLMIDAPSTVTSDQPISFTIKASLNTALPEGESMLQITYPNNFIYENAVPLPAYNNSMWSLKDLSITNPITININGRIVGQEQDQQVFHIYAGTVSSVDKSYVNVVYNSLLQTVTIIKPFLETNIIANDTVSAGDNVNVRITWKNNLSTRITDAQIIATPGGNVLDRNSIMVNDGFFDSLNNKIIWDRNLVPELAEIDPGEKGEVSFSLKSISQIEQGSIKNPQISVDVSIKGSQPSLGSVFTDINNFAKKVIKIASSFQIVTGANYKSGALPPKAELGTEYNVTWTLSNSTNDISNAVARATIPRYVKWIGPITQKENITYNDGTREVIWNIGSVRSNTGSNYDREVSFTIALTPSISQVGSIPQLMGDLFLTGTDTFTNTPVEDKRGPINTILIGDPHFQYGQERVIQ